MPVGNSLTNSNTNISQKNNSVKNSITGFYKNDTKTPEKGTENSLKTPEKAVRFSINKKFAEEYDKWNKINPRIVFRIGTTSEVLQKIGIENKNIYWDAAKIIKIKSKHREMTDEMIKQVPYILEYPIVVMQSKTKSQRVTMFGEVYTGEKPILAILEMRPTGHGNISLDEFKIASAYGKDNAQHFINTSVILYVDSNKKRVSAWEKRTRLQLPVSNSLTNSNTNISRKNNSVKNSISGFYKKDTKAQGKEAKALLKTLKAESESYKRKQIDGQSIRNYTYKKSQNDKDEGVSNEYEPKHGEQTNGIQREETVVYTRDDRRVRGRGGPAGYRDDGRGKEKSDSFLRRTKEESAGFLRRTAEKGLQKRKVGARYYAYRPVKATIKERRYYE